MQIHAEVNEPGQYYLQQEHSLARNGKIPRDLCLGPDPAFFTKKTPKTKTPNQVHCGPFMHRVLHF